MIVTAREFTSAAPFLAQTTHYADVRRRLFGPSPVRGIKTVAAAVASTVPEPISQAEMPLWTVVEIFFDWHVKVWREAIERQVSDLAHENAALKAALSVHRADMEMAVMPRRLTKHIIADVLENFPGVTWGDVKGHRRTRDVVYPRQLCMYEVHRQRKDLSYPAIGRLFGGRDHTTVLYSVRKIAALRGEA